MISSSPLPEQSTTSLAATWSAYRVYGLTLLSDYPFASRQVRSTDRSDLSFSCVADAPLAGDWERDPPAYISPYRTEHGDSWLRVHRLGPCDVLRVTRIADYYLWPKRIICHVLDAALHYLIEIPLLGRVLPFWLEREGIPTLHASAVVVAGRAAAFLSAKKGGKSALVAALMQAGHSLLTDDVLPIESSPGTFLGRPGYPTMRMWPDEAQHFIGHYEDLELVQPALSKRRVPIGTDTFGSFCDEPRPLACIYLPERRQPEEGASEIQITPVSPRDGVIELVRYSFVAQIVEPLGWQSQRLPLFAQLARQVPMRRVAYPSGFQHLPYVREAILADIRRHS